LPQYSTHSSHRSAPASRKRSLASPRGSSIHQRYVLVNALHKEQIYRKTAPSLAGCRRGAARGNTHPEQCKQEGGRLLKTEPNPESWSRKICKVSNRRGLSDKRCVGPAGFH
jgi:hypothetical protein